MAFLSRIAFSTNDSALLLLKTYLDANGRHALLFIFFWSGAAMTVRGITMVKH